MKNIRIERLNDSFQEDISRIIYTELKDKNLSFTTITEVQITNDLSYAKVYFTSLSDSKKDKILETLIKATPLIKKHLAKKYNIFKIPELKFIYDNSYEYGKHIDEIMENLNNEKK